MKRKGLSKRLRFEVLRRDNSTCRYCGRTPPDVVLEIDHLIPVAKGGGDEILNLVAACEDCNAGKSARMLDDDSISRVEQSNVDDMRQKIDEQIKNLAEKEQVLQDFEALRRAPNNEALALVRLWSDLTGLDGWSIRDLKRWVRRYEFETVVKAMYEVADTKNIKMVRVFASIAAQDRKEPGVKRCHMLRAYAMKKWPYLESQDVLSAFLKLLRIGGDLDELEYAVRDSYSAIDLQNAIAIQWSKLAPEDGTDDSAGASP